MDEKYDEKYNGSFLKNKDIIFSTLLFFVVSLSFIAPIIMFTGSISLSSEPPCILHDGDKIIIISKLCGRALDDPLTPGYKHWTNIFNSLVALVLFAIIGIIASVAQMKFRVHNIVYTVFRLVLTFIIFVLAIVVVASTRKIVGLIQSTSTDISFLLLVGVMIVSMLSFFVMIYDRWNSMHKVSSI